MLGVRRTLQCCGQRSCPRWCPWAIWLELWKLHQTDNPRPEDLVFGDANGHKLSKFKMVEGWKRIAHDHVQGHSARRSGAMHYARLGVPIQELEFLGRWKSSVVLTYAEEALQSEPANKKLVEETQQARRKPPRPPPVDDAVKQKEMNTPNDKPTDGKDLLVSKLPKDYGCPPLLIVQGNEFDT